MFKFTIHSLTSFVLFILSVSPPARPASVTPGEITDIFNRLERTRKIYNTYNDTLRFAPDKESWVNLFMERSRVNYSLHSENSESLTRLAGAFSTEGLSDEHYRILYNELVEMQRSKTGDPFIIERMCSFLIPYFEKKGAENIYDLALCWYYNAVNKHEIALVGEDKDSEDAYNSYKNALNLGRTLLPERPEPYMGALTELTSVTWPRWRHSLVDEMYAYRDTLEMMMADPEITSALPAQISEKAERVLGNFNYSIMRNLHPAGLSGLSDQQADSLLEEGIKSFEGRDNYSLREYFQYLMFRYRRGEITADEALARGSKAYLAMMRIPRVIDSRQLYEIHVPLLDLAFYNDVSSRPTEHKKLNVEYIVMEIKRLLRALASDQTDNHHITVVKKFLGYHRITDYLSPEEKSEFMESVMALTNVATYAHSIHMGHLASVLMGGVQKYRPDLMPKTDSVTDWKKFVKKAAIYHDYGKNFIFPIITNEYRKLTDHEYRIIRLHPELGLSSIKTLKELEPYRDLIVGHHKWYNGKGGYPDSFDNTASPLKTAIDVMTICDCLEAATDLVGRNYSQEKDFDIIINEMRAESGTRYNPEIMDIIFEHPDVYESMRFSIEQGWVDIYFDIYEKYLSY